MASTGVVCLFASVLLIGFSESSSGQSPTGFAPFGSFSDATDAVNNANLNAHIAVPIFSHTGRGLSFSYTLGYDSLIFAPVSGTWSPAGNWGWTGITQAQTGYITFSTSNPFCIGGVGGQRITWTIFGNFQYWDNFGTSHRIPATLSTWQPGSPCGNGTDNRTAIAIDGSGFTLTLSSAGGNQVTTRLNNRSGEIINVPQQQPIGSGSVTDTNGNQIVATALSTTSFYDTLNASVPALAVSGTGTPASPRTFIYTNPSGTASQYTVNYTNYSVSTNFGCSGVTEYSNASQPLVSGITLPNLTSYTFAYEATPGFAGSVTGRLKSVTLPAGGMITYTVSV